MIENGRSGACLYCEARFQTSNSRRLFCSDRCKTRYSRENRSCFYCGEIAEGRDHVVPHSLTVYATGNRHWSCDWVNSCGECNSLIGPFLGRTFFDRVMFLHDAFKKKKKLHKSFVEWDDEDLADMDSQMRNWIWNKQQARMRDERRLSHIRITALKVARFVQQEKEEEERP